MSVDSLLSKLDGVRRTGQGRWIAKCPAHDDRKASLSIREIDDGRVLVHDFAGCHVESVLSAVGLTFDDLFPPREISYGKAERRPFNAIDILRCIAFEALIVAVAAGNLAKHITLTEQDYERLMLAGSRLQHATEVANG